MKGVEMMKTLVKYEFLKILRKKSTLIVMAVSLLLTAFLFGLPDGLGSLYPEPLGWLIFGQDDAVGIPDLSPSVGNGSAVVILLGQHLSCILVPAFRSNISNPNQQDCQNE